MAPRLGLLESPEGATAPPSIRQPGRNEPRAYVAARSSPSALIGLASLGRGGARGTPRKARSRRCGGGPARPAIARRGSRAGRTRSQAVAHEARKLAILALALALAACAATQAPTRSQPTAPGFLLGLWHGFIFPVAWVVSLFTDKVAVYAVPNNGGWYDFGYFLGIVVFGVGARKSHVVYRDRVIDVRARRID
jgi:hypothetical protein